MTLKIIQFLNLLAYGFVASQPMFYLLAMSRAQKNLRPSSYTELRNLLDNSLQISLRIVYYSTLLTSLVWFYYTLRYQSGFLLVSASIALAAFLTDMFFLFKGDMPINKIIQTWTPENYPPNWETYRRKWFYYYHRRQVADLIGFVSLLAGVCFG
jgi:hypothetical protein